MIPTLEEQPKKKISLLEIIVISVTFALIGGSILFTLIYR